jgi:hypothetical protein
MPPLARLSEAWLTVELFRLLILAGELVPLPGNLPFPGARAPGDSSRYKRICLSKEKSRATTSCGAALLEYVHAPGLALIAITDHHRSDTIPLLQRQHSRWPCCLP